MNVSTRKASFANVLLEQKSGVIVMKKKMKILFICHQNVNRSRTAERIFRDRFETRSAGVFNLKPVTRKELEWADIIMVMEEPLRREIGLRFPDL